MEVNELRDFINEIEIGKSKYILGYPNCIATNVANRKGVAIEIKPNMKVCESFHNVSLETCILQINGQNRDFAFLYTKQKEVTNTFAILCLDFIDFSKRDRVLKNPMVWFDEWKELLGNTIRKKKVYDIIGEMKTLLELQKRGEKPEWKSIDLGTYDIQTEKALYEVKTTKSKSLENATINSQFQLANETELPLNLAFCKVEKYDKGDSIDSLYNELVENGFNKVSLDDYLDEIGYFEGKEERYISYVVHEIRLYPVDDTFPKIDQHSFKGDKYPNGIVKIEYTIALDGLDYTKLI